MTNYHTERLRMALRMVILFCLLSLPQYALTFEVSLDTSDPIVNKTYRDAGGYTHEITKEFQGSCRLSITGGSNYQLSHDGGDYSDYTAGIDFNDVIDIRIDNFVEGKNSTDGYFASVKWTVNHKYSFEDTTSFHGASPFLHFSIKDLNKYRDDKGGRLGVQVTITVWRDVSTPGYDRGYLAVGKFHWIRINYDKGNIAEKDSSVVVEDVRASTEAGEGSNPIPLGAIAAITGSLLAGAGGLLLTRKKKGGNGPDKGGPPDRAEMRIYKAFGDTLTPGEAPRQVFARIVRIKADGTEYTDPTLTQMLQISAGDQYMKVDGGPMYGEWKTAWISAPVPTPTPCPQEGIVCFSFGNSGGSYTNRLHFWIKEAEMHFAQENLTLPARYNKVSRLPFVVDGMEDDARVTVTLTDKGGRPSDMYDIHVEYNKEKQVQEAVIMDKVLEEEKDSHTPGHFIELNMHLVAVNASGMKVESDFLLVRFYMGLVYDIGVGYEGYEVGCYFEQYNPEKHTEKLVWAESGGKTYVPAETRSFLRLYDYDEQSHSVIIISPVPDPKLFSIRTIDETEQERVNKLGLNFQTKDTGHPRGTVIILRCLQALLDAPSRIDAVLQFGTKYKGKEYKCETQVLLCSQPHREHMDNAAVRDPLVKEDRRLLKHMEEIENNIMRLGLSERLAPLIKFIHLWKFGYLEDYGVDSESAKTIARVYAYMLGTVDDYERAEAKPLSLAGEIGQFFADYGKAMVKTYNEWASSPYFQVPLLLARIGLGLFTLGKSECIFRLYDAFSIGMLEISMAELYVNEGRDAVTNQMKAMVIEAGKWQIFHMGISLCLHIAVTPVPGQSKPPIRPASSSKPKPKVKPKPTKNQYSTGKKGEASKKAFDEAAGRQKKARADVRSPEARTKTKGKRPAKSLKEGIDYGGTKAKKDISNLKSIIEECEKNPSKDNLKKLRELVLEVQSNKQAMYKLKNLGSEYDGVRKAFNMEMMKLYNETDIAVMRDLAKKYGLKPSDIRYNNVSSSSFDALIDGKTITFDRDITYYYIKDGKKVYFDQITTRELYNRHFYKQATGIDTAHQSLANRFSRKMDQTNIEDVINEFDSFGKEENLKVLFDKNRHTEALPDAQKVKEAMVWKTEEWLLEGERKLAAAERLEDPVARKALMSEAVSDLMEGNRQTLKDFKNFIDPYDKARADINGKSFVTDNLRGAMEEIELLFDKNNPIDIDELNVKLSNRGYTYRSVIDEAANALYRAAGGR